MRTRNRVIVATLAQLLAATVAFADCIIPPPLCESFWTFDAVFDGTAVRDETVVVDTDDYEYSPERQAPVLVKKPVRHRLVTFQMHRSWRGDRSPEIAILETPGAESFKAVLGRRYLILASSWNGRLVAQGCGRSLDLQQARDNLAFLESLGAPSTGGRVFGTVRMVDVFQRSADTPLYPPVTTRVTLTGAGVERAVESTGGRFEFIDVAAGDYTLRIDLPAGSKAPDDGIFDLRLPVRQSCAEREVMLRPAGSIEGWILDSDGVPMQGAQVELMRAETWREFQPLMRQTSTWKEDGRFEFDGVSPGRYVVSVRPRYEPGQRIRTAMLFSGSAIPHEIPVVASERVMLAPFRFRSPEPAVGIRLALTWSDGRPVNDASLRIIDVTDAGLPERMRSVGTARSDEGGYADVQLLASRKYVVSVWTDWGNPPSAPPRQISVSEPFTAGADQGALNQLRLVLPRPRP
jgi:hypothetical protein